MSSELIGMFQMTIALAGTIVPGGRTMRSEILDIRRDIGDQGERMARSESSSKDLPRLFQ